MKKSSGFFFFILILTTLINAQDFTPPSIPQNVKSISYELHIDLTWKPNIESDLAGYKIYKWNGSSFQFLTNVKKYRSFFSDWIGSASISNKYKISAYDISNNESQMSVEVSTLTHQMIDSEFLDMTQRAAFRYFWDWGDPISGIARERYEPNENDITNTSGGGGFGVMAIIVGIERGFITRDEGVERVKKIVDFLANKIEKFHGAFPHWFNGTTGKVIPFGTGQNGADIVETSFMIQGLLTARQYFNGSTSNEVFIRNTITQLWLAIDWDFFRNGSTGLYWNWSPTNGFNIPNGGTFLFHGWSETMITYLLAAASPTHPVLETYYRSGWGNNGAIKYAGLPKYGYQLYVGTNYGGPLFWTHYSYLGFDPRGKRDLYANYFVNNYNQTMINRAYCIENPKGYAGYNNFSWGLTASYSIPGVYYQAHQPGSDDNGTIAPTAAISSMPYFIYENQNHSLDVIKYFYRTYRNQLWRDFGFTDAFNLGKLWFCDSYLAIDQGPIICMIENYRSQLLWNLFMSNQEIKDVLPKLTFFGDKDPSGTNDQENIRNDFMLYQNFPNPFNPSTTIRYQLSAPSHVSLKVFNALGKEISTLINEFQNAGIYNYQLTTNNYQLKSGIPYRGGYSSGVYYYRLTAGNFSKTGKMVIMK
jgi:hypothetical protein